MERLDTEAQSVFLLSREEFRRGLLPHTVYQASGIEQHQFWHNNSVQVE